MDPPPPAPPNTPSFIPYSNKSKLKAKNEALYRKIKRCLENENHHLILKLFNLNLILGRPEFDYFFYDGLIIKELLKEKTNNERRLIYGEYERGLYWKFYFEHVFDEKQKLKYAEYYNLFENFDQIR